MSFQHPCTIEQLTALFERAQDEILAEWRQRAAELLRELQLDKTTITDHVPEVILEITRDLGLWREGALPAQPFRGNPIEHGVRRYHDGLDVGEVVAEYNLLRVAFNVVAERHGIFVSGQAAHIINHRIDEAVRLAVMAFARQQEVIRKQKDADHLAFIAHDLRTPLNAIALLSAELRETLDAKAVAETTDLFEILDRNLGRLADLIQRVLKTNALPLSGGSFEPERRTFELWPLAQRLILDLRAVFAKDAITVVNEIPRALTVFADAELIAQVLQNLLGNAFKYAPGGRVAVSAHEEAGCVVCVVRDNGAGISAEMLPRIFDKLATDPAKQGTGLGLAIVRQIVEAHGGTVKVESAPGAGAAFSFTIPVPPAGD